MVCVVIGARLGFAAAALAQAPVLTADAYTNEQQIVDLLWQRAPEVVAARGAVGTAASELLRSRQFPNPALDTQWGTIPLGKTNPHSLHDPLNNVPNYTAGLSELFELGKRGPRQAAAGADMERSRQEALAVLGDRFFTALERISTMAMNQQRASVLDEQIENGQELLMLDQARASKGEIAQLDVDVAEVEHARLVAARDAALSEMAAAQADCSALLAAACPSFDSGEAARTFLAAGAASPASTQWTDEAESQRPDISALSAAIRSADERATLAQRRIIPDVTVRLGYTYDEFIASGNQRNSMAVGMQMPLPVLDQGQADLMAALSDKQRAEQTRASLISTAPDVLNAAFRRRDLVRKRTQHLDSAIERAHTVSDALGKAQRAGGTSLIEVLLARRSYQDLLRERLELDGDAFDASLAIRRTLGLFPRPSAHDGEHTP